MQPGEHADNISIHGNRRLSEGDRADGRRRICSNPGQFLKTFHRIRKNTVVIVHDGRRAFMEITRAGIIPKPGPSLQNIVRIRFRQILEPGPQFQKPLKIGDNGGDRRLLQHYFAQPDPIGVGLFSASAAPGKIAGRHPIPTQQSLSTQPREPWRRGKGRFYFSLRHEATRTIMFPVQMREQSHDQTRYSTPPRVSRPFRRDRGFDQTSLRQRGLASGAVIRDWPSIVGPHLAGRCQPDRIVFPVAGGMRGYFIFAPRAARNPWSFST